MSRQPPFNARLEADIARLHRAVHAVIVTATLSSRDGLADDMLCLLRYVTALGEAELFPKRTSPPLPGQLTLTEPNESRLED